MQLRVYELRPLWVNGLVKKVQNRTGKDLNRSFSPFPPKSIAYKPILADIGLIWFKFSRGRDCSPDKVRSSVLGFSKVFLHLNQWFLIIPVVVKRRLYSTLLSIERLPSSLPFSCLFCRSNNIIFLLSLKATWSFTMLLFSSWSRPAVGSLKCAQDSSRGLRGIEWRKKRCNHLRHSVPHLENRSRVILCFPSLEWKISWLKALTSSLYTVYSKDTIIGWSC